MIDTSAWVNRIADLAPSLVDVGAAADLAAAQKGTVRTPSGWVLIGTERALENPYANAVDQEVIVEIGIVIAVRNVKSPSGAPGMDALREARGEIEQAVLGWQPDDANDMVEYLSGSLLGFDNMVLWWMDTYSTSYSKRGT